MLDNSLAELYGVPTKSLNLAVKRKLEHFPDDFMFQLTQDEAKFLRFQIETSKTGRGGRRYLPYVFTQEGVAMLSSVLTSKRAVAVNIQIMRVFVRLRNFLFSHKDLTGKIDDLERKLNEHDKRIMLIFNVIKQLLTESQEDTKKQRPIGFCVPLE